MKKFLILWMLTASLAASAQLAYISGQGVANNPFNGGMVPLSYAQVRVCTVAPGLPVPCTLAQIFDVNGNPLPTSLGPNFGQLTTDVLGRYQFACAPGNYNIQIQASGNNSPSTNIVVTCPANGTLVAASNTWTGANTFTQTISGTGGINVSGNAFFGAIFGTLNGPVIGDVTSAATSTFNVANIKNRNGTRMADQYAGADASIKINACITDVIASGGGTCDATGLFGAQTISQEIAVGDGTHPVLLKIPQFATWTVSITNGTSCGIRVFQYGTLLGFASSGANASIIQAQASTNARALVCTDYGAATSSYVRMEGFQVYNPSGGTLGSGLEVFKVFDGFHASNIVVANYNGVGLYVHKACCGATFDNIVANGNNVAGTKPVVIGNVGDATQNVAFISLSADHSGIANNEITLQGGVWTNNIDFFNTYTEGNLSAAQTAPNISVSSSTYNVHFYGVQLGSNFAGATQYLIDLAGGDTSPTGAIITGALSGTGNVVNDHINGITATTTVNKALAFYSPDQLSFRGFNMVETTAPAVSGVSQDVCYADPTAHGIKCSFNTDAYTQLVRVGTATVGKAACIKSSGIIGFCSTVPDSTGSCTCN